MKTIKYRVTFAEGDHIFVEVQATSINGGIAKALATILDTHAGVELNKIEFWMVQD